MKRIIFILLMILVMDTAIFAQGKNYIKYETEHPSICVEINNKKLNFLVDTGAPKSILFSKGLRTLGVERENKKNNIDFDEVKKVLTQNKEFLEQLGVTVDEFMERGKVYNGLYISYPNIRIGSKEFDFELFYEERFDKISEYLDFDGLIGMDVLTKFETFIIDYSKKKIFFDTKNKIKKDLVQMYLLESRNNVKLEGIKFYINAKINGEEMKATLDTGNWTGVIVIPDPTVLTSGKEKNENIANMEYFFRIDLEIGSKQFNNLKACFSSHPGIITAYDVNQLGVSEVNIGHEFFKDKIIQFDFKNKTFGIK